MEYSTKAMAELSGVTARTLRHYHEIGILQPLRINPSGYRIYGPEQVDQLQQILFFRTLGFPLSEIKKILIAPDFDRVSALAIQLTAMKAQKTQLECIINTLQKTLQTMKGEQTMSDQEKFEGFKKKMLDENEVKYGEEVREKYGDEVAQAANSKIKNMTQLQMEEAANLSEQVNVAIAKALADGDPTGSLAMEACALHKKWLSVYWPEGYYRPEAHKGLADMYCQDPRFQEYYDKLGPGCAVFLRNAIYHFCEHQTDAPVAVDSKRNPAVDAYLKQYSDPIQGTLRQLRELILKTAPEATERISYGMPTYTMKENLVHFAGYSKHIGFYPTPEGIEAFAEELSGFETSKGAIRFPVDKPLPWELIERIVHHRVLYSKK